MKRTLGYHVVKSGYGLWLPGDQRGHWSKAWDDDLGLIEPGVLHQGDPIRRRMAIERMKHPPVRLNSHMISVIAQTLEQLVLESSGYLHIAALAIESTHMHMLIPYSGRDIDKSIKWIGDRTTKAVHALTEHQGPVWCQGRWRTFLYDEARWNSTTSYIRQHNVRRRLPMDPYPFVSPIIM